MRIFTCKTFRVGPILWRVYSILLWGAPGRNWRSGAPLGLSGALWGALGRSGAFLGRSEALGEGLVLAAANKRQRGQTVPGLRVLS